jgi:hypothetical protein
MTEYSRWFNIRGKLSNREYSEIKNTVMFSTFTVYMYMHLIFFCGHYTQFHVICKGGHFHGKVFVLFFFSALIQFSQLFSDFQIFRPYSTTGET